MVKKEDESSPMGEEGGMNIDDKQSKDGRREPVQNKVKLSDQSWRKMERQVCESRVGEQDSNPILSRAIFYHAYPV